MLKRLFTIVLTLAGAFVIAAASGLMAGENGSKVPGRIASIANERQYQSVLESSRGRLVVIDHYADWCSPCRKLAPVLESVAEDFSGKVDFFKIDVDAHRDIARKAGVRGIPYVQFILDGKPVHTLMGVHPKDAYIRTVQRFAPKMTANGAEGPDGSIVNGVRVVERSAQADFDSVYVYRGETVRIVVRDIAFPYGIAIPEFDIRREAGPGDPLEITFKAKTVGIFPVFCNGNCPSGEEIRHGQVVVMPFASGREEGYSEIDAKEARELIADRRPLILDVRTPGEYYAGHIEGARLIPVSQLQARINELSDTKGKPILVYCRSGNRSVVASEILIEGGFEDIFHLRGGILDWQRAGYPLAK